MWFLTFTNEASARAEFFLQCFGTPVGARVVDPGQGQIMPFPGLFVLTATAVVDGQTITSMPQEMQGDSGSVTAAMFDDQVLLLEPGSGSTPHTFLCTNGTPVPVTFTLSIDELPVQSSATADANTTIALTTIPEFACGASAGGVNVAPITFSLAQAAVTLSDGAHGLALSVREIVP